MTPFEEYFLEKVLMMTGREGRLSCSPILTRDQAFAFKALLPELREATRKGLDPAARCDLMNRVLLVLGIKPFSLDLFRVVFERIDLADEAALQRQTERFRALCMLEFGSFRFGYKVLKSGEGQDGTKLHELWNRYFPSAETIGERVDKFKKRPVSIGLISIPPADLVALGYLSGERAKKVNDARATLRQVLDAASTRKLKDGKELIEIAQKEFHVREFARLLTEAGVADAEHLLAPGLYAPGQPFYRIIEKAKENCTALDPRVIEAAQRNGVQNTLTYLALHDVDIYIATSMRDPHHFTNNHAFVTQLFKESELAEWHLRYFDPTQSYVPDRIQKGLIECLMIKRARVIVYNAQERDTFGKDAEAAVALAQGKPVVVYVARLFPKVPRMADLYRVVDSATRTDKDSLLGALARGKFIDNEDEGTLGAPEKSILDCIEFAVTKVVNESLKEDEAHIVEAELVRHGYEPPKGATPRKLIEEASDLAKSLEQRAFTFRDIHPLSLQTSPSDGVARGVIVTRSIDETAMVLRGLLVGGMEYEIVDGDVRWSLLEKGTRSTIRVVSKDAILTTAFWCEWEDPVHRIQ